eukprot:7941611-Lingulodinium_polyedra.AAC.1
MPEGYAEAIARDEGQREYYFCLWLTHGESWGQIACLGEVSAAGAICEGRQADVGDKGPV